MGLFGLFVSLVGFGAMTKDTIEGNIFENNNYKNAKRQNKDTYIGHDMKIYSTETKKRVYVDYGLDGEHTYLRDYNTKEIIKDYTYEKLKKMADEINRKLPSYCVFFKKPNKDVLCWVSNKYSGIFQHQSSDFIKRKKYDEVDELSYFYNINNCIEKYFSDGTLYSSFESKRRKIEHVKKIYKNAGYKFYPIEISCFTTYPVKASEKVLCLNWRNVDTDEEYSYDIKEKCFIKKIPCETIINVAKKHHKPEYEKRIKYINNPDGERFNIDGTKWYK